MPFDDFSFPDPDAAALRRNRRLVAFWLLGIAGMLVVMIVLGGATRATGSGLSIMEWDALSGILPPLSHAEWERLFALYKTIPQYELLHHGMTLAGFKSIFWLEWVHRFWGRLMGVAFAVPLVVLAATGRIERRLIPRLVLFFILGGLQGAVGWFMVRSGFFADATAVEPARLVAHLSLALTLFGAILWTALSFLDGRAPRPPGSIAVRRLALASLVAVAFTIIAGGFVAGLHAGLIDNTFPLMDGRLVPRSYASLSPFPLNWIANPEAAQFDHRLLATMTVLLVSATVIAGLHAQVQDRARAGLLAMGLVSITQYALGIVTLLDIVPLPLAVLHQTTAVLLLAATLATVHALRGSRPLAASLR